MSASRDETIGTYHAALAGPKTGVHRFVVMSTDRALISANVVGGPKHSSGAGLGDGRRVAGVSEPVGIFGPARELTRLSRNSPKEIALGISALRPGEEVGRSTFCRCRSQLQAAAPGLRVAGAGAAAQRAW